MQNLFRRPSGVYVFRLTVPMHLRAVVGIREVLKSTGTSELSIAKMVAGSLAAQWLQYFVDADRLLAVAIPTSMSLQEILKIAHGHPALLADGHPFYRLTKTECLRVIVAKKEQTGRDKKPPRTRRRGKWTNEPIPASRRVPHSLNPDSSGRLE